MAAPQNDEDEQKRRASLDAVEEEEAYHAALEEEERQAAEQRAADRQSAIDTMVEWFSEQFEDPQNETPYDSEDGDYVYVFGGPFEAGEVLYDQFGSEYDQEWIDAAVEQVQADGTYEWAPSSNGEYYEHPERDDDGDVNSAQPVPADIRNQILDRLDELEDQLAKLSDAPPSLGHNHPPNEIGLPPYDDDSRRDLEDAIATTRQEISADQPDQIRLGFAEGTFRRISAAIAGWVGRKLDLVVDESIKAGVKLIIWGEVAKIALSLANDIGKALGHVF